MLSAVAHVRGEAVSRRILALYDSHRGQTPAGNHVHANAEVILNYLGCFVEYWDIQQGLPDEKTMAGYRGVLTWFYADTMSEPEAYLGWARRQVEAGRKFVILGNLGAHKEARSGRQVRQAALDAFTKKLGFVAGGVQGTTDLTKIELTFKDPAMVEFERKLDFEITHYEKYRARHPKSRVYLRLRRTDRANSESDLVFTTPHGGFAAAPYVLYQNQETFQRKWRIDPFRFFSEAFDLKALPKPDPNTLNGMRVWTSHIDGDAFISKSQARPEATCAEVIRDEILRKYRWPISVSVVVGEVVRDPQFLDIARSIFELEWIEPASHAYSHPYYWEDTAENRNIYERRHLPIPGYTFNLKQEIVGSVKYINTHLLPAGKKVKQFFWTGNCQPTREAVRLCKLSNLRNINGGDTIFDPQNSSYTNVAPFGVDVGGYRQIYAPHSNENIYTNDWRGPFYAFRHVLKTFENTETPVRIKPINIYYHYYSGERWASLNALEKVMEETITRQVAPIFISEYIDRVNGFYSTRIERLGEDTWKIKSFGQCRTIRFDDTERYPDLQRSSNVLGFTRHQGVLYVHLGERSEAVIVLVQAKPDTVYLERASHHISRWSANKSKVSFVTGGFGKGEFVIANLFKNREYTIRLRGPERQRYVLRSDINGTLSFLYTMGGDLAVEVKEHK
ncbi:MAG: hypothetical protein ACE5IY_16835 [bacterium]